MSQAASEPKSMRAHASTVIRLATDSDLDRWNRYLAHTKVPTGLGLYEWRRIIADSYGNETRFYLAERGDKIVGVLPGYVARSLRGRRRFFSLRSGAVADDESTLEALVNAVSNDAAMLGWRDSTVIHRGAPPPGFNVSEKATLVFRLGDTEEADWKALSQKARNKVRKARKSGLTFAAGPEYMDAVYALYRENLVRLGVPHHPHSFFRVLSDTLREKLTWAVAVNDGVPIAGMGLFSSPGGAVHDFQAASIAHRNDGPVQLLNWEGICWCREHGMPLLDFGESSEGSPVYRSKTGFGAAPEILTYVHGGGDSSPKATSGPKSSRSRRTGLRDRAPFPVRSFLLTLARRKGRIL